ncbi:MAG: hypothetical protein LBG52_05735 [Candidatus Peribacteria bacterium]|jgi:hypothetical protein|nr:hypothetical protein [Candidatus Peribacteria bacterium]
MRGRRITIEGVIIAESRENTSRAMDYLDRLFVLQGEVDKAELFPFLITDEQGRERSIDAKIKEPIEYQLADDDYMEGTTRVWRVSLQAPDARFFSLIEQKVIGSE